MKQPKNSLLVILVLLNHIVTAGTPQLIGLTQFGGVNSTGTILHYSVGDTSINEVFNFARNPTNVGPYGGIIMATDGFLYGLSYYDGRFLNGTLFKYDYGNNAATTMVNFDSIIGDQPLDNLLQASNGLLYGTTTGGGGGLFGNPGDFKR